MDSSTSHSDSFPPRQAVTLLLTAAAAWAACIFYSLRLNPEVTHYTQGGTIKTAWSKKMTEEHGPKVVVFGGSSCEFSIDGERMLNQHDLPTVNCGVQAGMGAYVLTEAALENVKPGDTLIIALEPQLLTCPLLEPSLGVQYSFAMRHPDWVIDPVLGVGRINWFQAATELRPGGYSFLTLVEKITRRQALYAYKLSDYHPSGWAETDRRQAINGPSEHQIQLSEDSLAMLHHLRDYCARQDIRVAYSLPWCYTPEEKARAFQQANVQFLLQMAEIFPVLKDPRLGADTDVKHYADTDFHLVSAVAAVRTDELAEQIKNWDVWTVAELKAREAGL